MPRAPALPANLFEGAHDIAAPTDPVVAEIFRYWSLKRGKRRMPSRAEIDPVELRELVQHIVLFDVVEPGKLYRIRLVGGAVAEFAGVNMTGEWAETRMPPDSARQMLAILTSVVTKRAPRFRAGRTHFHATKSYRRFEACFLPLSPDNNLVDKIMAGIVFDRPRGAKPNRPSSG